MNDNFRAELKKIPEIAKARQEFANCYRKARKDNPRLARLLWKRVKAAEKQIANQFWNSAFDSELRL